MSIQAMSCAMAVRTVSPSEKLLLLVLANYADERMQSFPSHKRLASDTGLSERTVLTLMRTLEGRKMLTRTERRRQDGSRSTDLITLYFVGEVISGGGEMVSPRGEIDRKGVGKSFQGGGEMVSPLTTFEPVTEPLEEPRTPQPPRGLEGEFNAWWEIYPHKVGKPAAKTSFAKARQRATLAEMIAGVERYIRDKPPDRSWCNPTTWLNQDRWNDQPAPQPQAASRSDERSHPAPSAKYLARQANHERAFAGAEAATRMRGA